MYFVNTPLNHTGEFISHEEQVRKTLEATPTKNYYELTTTAKMRSGPSSISRSLTSIARGSEVELLASGYMDKYRNEWSMVRYNNRTGYVSTKFLRFTRSGY